MGKKDLERLAKDAEKEFKHTVRMLKKSGTWDRLSREAREAWARLSPNAQRIRTEIKDVESKIAVIESETASKLNVLTAKRRRLQRECPHENNESFGGEYHWMYHCLDCGAEVNELDLNQKTTKSRPPSHHSQSAEGGKR